MDDLIKRLETEKPGRELDVDIWDDALGLPEVDIRIIPRYTTSLDAALTLAGPGAFWRLWATAEGGYAAEVFKPLGAMPAKPMAIAATPAMALCAAALKARSK